MRIYNNYILSLVLVISIVNVFLAFLGQKDIQVYLAINIITYLVIMLLYVYLNPMARKALNIVGVVLFTTFILIVGLKVMTILTG